MCLYHHLQGRWGSYNTCQSAKKKKITLQDYHKTLIIRKCRQNIWIFDFISGENQNSKHINMTTNHSSISECRLEIKWQPSEIPHAWFPCFAVWFCVFTASAGRSFRNCHFLSVLVRSFTLGPVLLSDRANVTPLLLPQIMLWKNHVQDSETNLSDTSGSGHDVINISTRLQRADVCLRLHTCDGCSVCYSLCCFCQQHE